jgi:multidrug efflux pump subunit AcrA (membrane-fusion protein)
MKFKSLAWVIALAGCASASAGDQEQPSRERREPPPVEATRVEVATIQASEADLDIAIPGEVEGARDALLAAPQGGQVEAVLVREGARVRKGQPLVRIDSSVYRVHASRARAELDQAEFDHARMERLAGVVTGAEREASQTKLRVAKAAHDLAAVRRRLPAQPDHRGVHPHRRADEQHRCRGDGGRHRLVLPRRRPQVPEPC